MICWFRFFVSVGLRVDPGVLEVAAGPALILLGAAVLGKFLGDGGVSWMISGYRGGLLIGVSMIPRVEIALIVMERGLRLGEWAVSPTLFAQIVLVAATTAVGVPLLLRILLSRYPPRREAI